MENNTLGLMRRLTRSTIQQGGTGYAQTDYNLKIHKGVVNKIALFGSWGRPEEIGGMCFRRTETDIISQALWLKNVSPEGSKRGLYTMKAEDFIKTLTNMERRGFEWAGWWHTHPGIPAIPSGIDIANHKHPVPMVIYSVRDKDIRAYHWEGDNLLEIPVKQRNR